MIMLIALQSPHIPESDKDVKGEEIVAASMLNDCISGMP